MLVTMSEEKNTTVAENLSETTVETQSARKKPTYKKYIVLAVSLVGVIALVLAAILVGMYIYAQSIHDTLQYTVEFNDGNKQQVTHDVSDNIMTYHIGSGDDETWVINDFNRDIQLAKIMVNNEYQCLILPLNRTEASLPASAQNPPTTVYAGYNTGSNSTYVVSQYAITDKSMLSNAGQELCAGVDVKWIYPSCSAGNPMPNPTASGGIKKRQYQYCCFTWSNYCYWACSNYINNNACMNYYKVCRWARNYYMSTGRCSDNYCY